MRFGGQNWMLIDRRDMKLSTLKRYIEAMGGELDIVAKFASNEVHLNVKEL
jgi:Holliday junction resolvase-like predicted endonuclease